MKTKTRDYAAERLDPRWQKKRLEIFQRDGFKCVVCCSKTKTLTVHHSYYVKGRDLWNYPNFSLSTLCLDCHSEEQIIATEEFDRFEKIVERLTDGDYELLYKLNELIMEIGRLSNKSLARGVIKSLEGTIAGLGRERK